MPEFHRDPHEFALSTIRHNVRHPEGVIFLPNKSLTAPLPYQVILEERSALTKVPEVELDQAQQIAVQLQPDQVAPVMKRLKDEQWRARESKELASEMGRFAVALAYAERLKLFHGLEWYISPTKLTTRFNAESLVSSAILQWDDRKVRRNPYLTYSPYELSYFRNIYRAVTIAKFREIILRAMYTDTLSDVLAIINGKPDLSPQAAIIRHAKQVSE